ncbi:MAG: serine/threonine-protein kinase [Myxococcota bacterium]
MWPNEEEPVGEELTRPDLPLGDAASAQTPRRDPTALGAGDRVGSYEVIRQLGKGGMGRVYLARDIRLGRRVALKVLETHQPEFLARFLEEARATAQLTHENIVTLYDLQWHNLWPYLVLEYVPGKTLARWFQERIERTGSPKAGCLPPARAAELMMPVARALVFTHGAGIVHRDLKPSNIMLSESGTVKVLDFGIAKLLGPELSLGGHGPEAPGVGTRAYMAPEQWRGGEVDGRTDIWAMGVMLHWLLEGEHPAGPLTPESLRAIADLNVPLPSLHLRRPELGRIGAIVDRCLLKERTARLDSAKLLLSELEAVTRPNALRLEKDGEPVNPYPGLAAFQEQDAGLFFGREEAIERFVVQLNHRPLLAVVGSSGSGKSSFVRAGVMPALARSGDAWECFTLRPGPFPLNALAELLSQHTWLTSSGDRPDAQSPLSQAEITARLREEPGALGLHLRGRANRRLERILLFVDQFEEVVTMASDADRLAFLAALVGAADDLSSPVRVIISLRQDFLDRVAATNPDLAALLNRGTFLLGPLGPRELRMALVRPAESLDYRFESEQLVGEILAALSTPTGALPLLQFAAHRLWEGRDTYQRVLTGEAYRSFGGVAGALSRHASSVLSCMSATERDLARLLILRLVTPDRTRAVVTHRELASLGDGPELERVLGMLIDARLVAVDDISNAESTVELVHDSLIFTWPTLTRWLEEEEDSSRFQVRLRRAALEWKEAGQREGLLWRGDAAEDARAWAKRHGPVGLAKLGPADRRYLEAVLALLDRERRARRQRWAILALSLLTTLVVVSALALSAHREARRAELARAEAAQSAAEARNATRMATATALARDPTTVLALIREIEPGRLPHGWGALARWALEEQVARLVLPHPQPVLDAAYSPDGRHLATACQDGRVRILDASSGQEIHTLEGHQSAVSALAFAPDGARIAAGAADGSLRIWPTEGGAPTVLLGHTERVGGLAFSPDGTRLASASADKTARIWDLNGAAPAIILTGHTERVRRVAFSPDGKRVVTAGADGTVRIWSADGRGSPEVLIGHRGSVTSAVFSPDGTRILSASGDKTVRLWSVGGAGPPQVFSFDDPLAMASFSDDGRRIAAAIDGLSIYYWGLGEEQRTVLSGHSDVIFTVRFSPDGRSLVSASRDRSVRTWDIAGDRGRQVLRGHEGWVLATSISADQARIASGGRDSTVRLWSTDGSGAPEILRGHSGPVNDVDFSPDGKRLASGSSDGDVRIWDLVGGRAPLVLKGHKRAVRSVAFSPDGRSLLSASIDSTVRLWNVEDGAAKTVFTGHTDGVHAIAFSPDGSHFVSGSVDHSVRVWPLDGGPPAVLSGHQGEVYGVAFAPDGKRVASGSSDSTVRVWPIDGSSPPQVFAGEGPGLGLDRASFSRDGSRLVSNCDDGTVRIFDLQNKHEPLVLRASTKAANSAAFSRDDARIVAGTDEGTVVVWTEVRADLSPSSPELWAATRYCLPLERRRLLLDFPAARLEADEARCRAEVGR